MGGGINPAAGRHRSLDVSTGSFDVISSRGNLITGRGTVSTGPRNVSTGERNVIIGPVNVITDPRNGITGPRSGALPPHIAGNDRGPPMTMQERGHDLGSSYAARPGHLSSHCKTRHHLDETFQLSRRGTGCAESHGFRMEPCR
jgi:hypothetical protein